jgi:acyl carrier protein
MNPLNLRIKTLMIDRLNLRVKPEQIVDDAPIFGSDHGGLGLDSIDALDLAVGLFEEFQVEVGQKDMAIFASVNRIADFVNSNADELFLINCGSAAAVTA